jgi:hypothetical protein
LYHKEDSRFHVGFFLLISSVVKSSSIAKTVSFLGKAEFALMIFLILSGIVQSQYFYRLLFFKQVRFPEPMEPTTSINVPVYVLV